ncbi:MAG: pyruvate dehydrogenase (acetyl-transferring) E1 component subunit alpha [Saprospiraceae bacterium]|nr:pyruvate dehydrogenase (acetyl-transferring) E1 component subunit alpha [Saprospiraceae bacterium]
MAEVVENKPAAKGKASQKTEHGLDTHLAWYEMMLRIRRFEEKALMMYSQNKIRGFLHVYIGQEAIAGAMTNAIRPEDPVVTAYRQHGTAMSRGIGSKECMAELFGKQTGINKGKGGSMHFFSKEHYYFGGNGIVGAQIPIGTGIAFAEKYRASDNICITMFGDGAARQGALHESFNMAMLWNLPVLYICENNGYAMGTSTQRTSNVNEIHKLALGYDMPASAVDGMDVEAVYTAMYEAAEHVRTGNGPYFLEIKTYRYRGHSVSDPARYRSKEEVEEYKQRDPIARLEDKILGMGDHADKLKKIQEAIKEEIEEAVAFADESPFPDPSELYTDNYTQEDYPFLT